MTRYAAVYCRISEDKLGRREGVDAQERWGRDYAANAWAGVPVRVFTAHGWAFGARTGLSSTLYRWADRLARPLTTAIVSAVEIDMTGQ